MELLIIGIPIVIGLLFVITGIRGGIAGFSKEGIKVTKTITISGTPGYIFGVGGFCLALLGLGILFGMVVAINEFFSWL